MPTLTAQRPSYPDRGGPYDHTTAGISSKGHTWAFRFHTHTHTPHTETHLHMVTNTRDRHILTIDTCGCSLHTMINKIMC